MSSPRSQRRIFKIIPNDKLFGLKTWECSDPYLPNFPIYLY